LEDSSEWSSKCQSSFRGPSEIGLVYPAQISGSPPGGIRQKGPGIHRISSATGQLWL
ncbi:unnamed protein product, partial [Allacma fusca]